MRDYQKLFEKLPGSFAVFTPEFRVVAANDNYLRGAGMSREALIGRDVFEAFPDNPNDPNSDGPANLRRSLNKVLETRAPDTMPVQKYDIHTPEMAEGEFGEKYWSPSNTPVFDDAGNVEYIHHRVEDVTEYVIRTKHSKEREAVTAELESQLGRMEAEILRQFAEVERQSLAAEVHRESSRRFREMTNAAPTLVWTAGPDKLCDYFNQKWTEFTGRTLDQELGNAWLERIHPDDRERYYRTYVEAFEARRSFEIEYRLRQRDGQYRWLLCRGVPRNSTDMAFGGYIGSCADIQKLKDVEAALQLSEERYRSLVLATTAVVWITDASGRFAGSQPSWEAYTGQAEEIYRWRGGVDALHPDDRERVREQWARAVAERVAFECHYRCWHAATGKFRFVIARGIPILNADGLVREWIGTLTDVHDQKCLEENLQHSAKLESLGVLAGGVAHDFNNLLVGILGNASLALESVARTSPAHRMLHDVVDASERAANLTKQLLAYAGKGRFVVETVDMSALVSEISNLVQTSIPKHVKLRLESSNYLSCVEGDRTQLQQVVMNLVINGAEAIEPGRSGTVIVSTSVQEVDEFYIAQTFTTDQIKPGLYISVEVHDNGSGMDAATMARIFEPFFTTKFTGRGLGLAAVLGIVRSHGGALKVYSTKGNGTTFNVLLPASGNRPSPQSPALDAGNLAGSGTVLVIDDEELIRKTLKATLDRNGFNVIVAENGEEGVDLFRAIGHKVSLVILDMTMPVMSGEETFRHLKSINPDARVLLSSGYNEVETVQRFSGQGLAGFIQKPYTTAALLLKIQSIAFASLPKR